MKHYQRFISENGNIYLHKPGAEYAEFFIVINYKACWVHSSEFKKICGIFSLEEIDAKELIARWVEDAYKLKGINIRIDKPFDYFMLKIPSI